MSLSLFNQKFNETASRFSPLLYTVVKWGNVLGLLAIASKNRVVFILAIIDNCVGFSLAKQYLFFTGIVSDRFRFQLFNPQRPSQPGVPVCPG